MLDEPALRTLGLRFAERDAKNLDAYPVANVDDLKAAALLGAPFAPSLGGHGWTAAEAARAIELLASYSPSTALIWAMPLGFAGIYSMDVEVVPPEARTAWSAQVDEVTARYRAGQLYAACNSERGAGGSVAATQTTARRGADGVFRLTGDKILATSGSYADVFFSTAKVTPQDLPGAGVVEFFLVPTRAPGVEVLTDWDGFGMRSTESHTVRYQDAPAEGILGFPDFLARIQPLEYWFNLFAAIPLGCARGMLRALSTSTPAAPALRVRLNDARMRYEALRAYLLETAAAWRPAGGPEYAARVLRTKTYVGQEATALCATLFALGGGRHYRRNDPLARLLADSFAGTALRPPLPLALDAMLDQFGSSEEYA
ncbi:MAG: acyl-CoA dehydrogenase family protein [Dehalococcoidia bacterium]